MITIVLPVYNGGDLLRRCVESLAKQDSAPGAFDLVVLDNCSTDGALGALSILPSGIPRRVLRSESLLPIEQNWARIVGLTQVNPFITTIGHDDTLDPSFIRTMVRTLEADSGVRLLFSHFRLIDQDDNVIRSCLPMPPWESAPQFLSARLAGIRDSFGTGYVARFDDYREVGGIPGYAKLMYADDALWLKLARRSGMRILPEEYFSYRVHTSSTSQQKDSGLILQAFVEYMTFLEGEFAVDPGIRQALTKYGSNFVQTLSAHWIWEEATRANLANERVRTEVVEGWREVWRRLLALIGKPELYRDQSEEVAFSLWVNQHAVLRRLWARRSSRTILRTVRRVVKVARPGVS